MMKNKKSILFSFLLTMTLTACYDSLLDYDGNASIINREDGTSSSTGILANAELASEFLRTAQMRVIDSKSTNISINVALSATTMLVICLFLIVLTDV